MLETRLVYRSILIAVCCLLAVFAPGADAVDGGEEKSPFRFSSPQEGDLLAGPTRFEFEVCDGARIERIDVYVEGKLIGSAAPPLWRFDWQAPLRLAATDIVAVGYRGDTVIGQSRIETAELTFAEVVDVQAVQLYPVVFDRRGRYAHDLQKEEFQVSENGRKVDIEFFSRDAATMTVAILIDVSQSMTEDLGIVQEAACGFIDRLDREDRLAIYAFNHGLSTVSRLGTEHPLAKNEVRQLQAEGGTALYDAVIGVLADLDGMEGRKIVVVFSDGRDERSMLPLRQVVEAARSSEVIVYAIGAGEDDEDLARREDLGVLATETGGSAYFLDKIRKLPNVFDEILIDLRSQYSLSYTPPAGPAGIRTLEVRVTRKGHTVRCRKSYRYRGR